jgi:hypothetical protein
MIMKYKDLGTMLSKDEMKTVKGGIVAAPKKTWWACLFTLSDPPTAHQECSATDPSLPNDYCVNTKVPC